MRRAAYQCNMQPAIHQCNMLPAAPAQHATCTREPFTHAPVRPQDSDGLRLRRCAVALMDFWIIALLRRCTVAFIAALQPRRACEDVRQPIPDERVAPRRRRHLVERDRVPAEPRVGPTRHGIPQRHGIPHPTASAMAAMVSSKLTSSGPWTSMFTASRNWQRAADIVQRTTCATHYAAHNVQRTMRNGRHVARLHAARRKLPLPSL